MPFPLSTALRESLAAGYSPRHFMQDATAALIVSLMALPLAMALAIAVGLPPQHGIYTAIIAGIITPLLGGSVTQVSGPTAAFVVIIAPIVSQYGLRGLIIAEVMAGLMLVALAWMRLGRFIGFIPYPVTTGFTAGIAVVLATLSLNDLLGLGISQLSGSYVDKLSTLAGHLPQARFPEVCIGLVSLAVMFAGRRLTRRIPPVILGIAVGVVLTFLFRQQGYEVSTIGTHFSYETPQGIRQGIPPSPPVLHMPGEQGPDKDIFAWPSAAELRELFMPALVIAALAALESLLSATVADGLSRTRHNPNAELAAIGIANVASGLGAGIPATGAIARTATNIKSGARTPIASALHAVLIMLYVLALAPYIAYVPMASLAALLVLTAYNMSHYHQFYRILRIAPGQDSIVLLVCFGLTVFVDMVAGVTVGVLLAALLFIQRMSTITEVHVEEVGGAHAARLPEHAVIYHISGPLFFATVERCLDRARLLSHRIDALVLDMEHVPLIDMTGLIALKTLVSSDVLKDKQVFVCVHPAIAGKVRQKLEGLDRFVHVTDTVEHALLALER